MAIVDLVYRSRIMAECPPGHDIIVDVSYYFRPINRTVSVLVDENKACAARTIGADAASEGRVRLIPAGTPFIEEHFEALLELPLGRRLQKFVEFFLKRKNRPATPEQWAVAGFTKKELADINHLCAVHGLWMRLRITEQGKVWSKNGFQFAVMQEAPKPRKEETPLPRFDLMD